MKSFVSRTAALFAASLLFAAPAFAETNIGVVNVQKVMRDSKAYASVKTQMQSKQKSFQSDLDSKEKELTNEYQALVKAKGSMDKEAFAKKAKDFQVKEAAARREVDSKKSQINKAFSGALDNILNNATSISKEIAAQKKLTMVISSNQVLYAETSMDITEEVLSRLNSKLPSVAVKF